MEQPLSFSLRPASIDDIAKLVEIDARVNPAPWTAKNFEAELEKPYAQTLVISDDETDEIIAGYIVFWVMLDDCQILNIATDLPYRGLGFAKRMVRQACQNAIKNGLKSASLDVRKSNLPAIQLYQGLGFSISSIRKGFYSNGEDAYQMTNSLEDDGVQI
jgi:ribosomal-protein-alanine N-acetyltransferase